MQHGNRFALPIGSMEEQSRATNYGGNPWAYNEEQDSLAQPAILLVEDDTDIREMMATLLGMAGFEVVACESAEHGLNALREQEFDLILTDYALPRQSGLWLLNEAETEGLIQGTPVLIVTAHPDVTAHTPYEIIQKPFDLDELIERVRRQTEGAGSSGPKRRRFSMPVESNGFRGGTPDCPEPVELILYVSSASPRSFAAVRNIKKVLERFHSSKVKLTVCDLSIDPNGGIADSVAFTPTLVRRSPGPRTFILGHITNPELVLELLADCGEPN
jgi:DNA-binding response OmpR family regulator